MGMVIASMIGAGVFLSTGFSRTVLILLKEHVNFKPILMPQIYMYKNMNE